MNKSKSADEILSSVIKSKYTKENFKEQQVKSHYKQLNEILTKTPKESEFYRHLVVDYKNEINHGKSLSPFPRWIRKIAYCLANPDLKLSSERVQLVREYCAEVCEEFLTGKEPETTRFLAKNDDFEFLSHMAQALMR